MYKQIHRDYTSFEPHLLKIIENFDREGTVIYKSRNTVKVFDMDGCRINVKRYKCPILINSIIYTFFRTPKAERAYCNTIAIKSLQFEVPRPVAFFTKKKFGLLKDSYYFSLQVDYGRNMYEFGSGGIEGREDIIAAFARYTAELHSSGVLHKDYSPGNILFDRIDDKIEFCLVDLNRMAFREINIEEGCANFARMWGDDEMFDLIAAEYAKARNGNIEQCAQWIFKYRRRFWKKYARKHPVPPFKFER